MPDVRYQDQVVLLILQFWQVAARRNASMQMLIAIAFLQFCPKLVGQTIVQR